MGGYSQDDARRLGDVGLDHLVDHLGHVLPARQHMGQLVTHKDASSSPPKTIMVHFFHPTIFIMAINGGSFLEPSLVGGGLGIRAQPPHARSLPAQPCWSAKCQDVVCRPFSGADSDIYVYSYTYFIYVCIYIYTYMCIYIFKCICLSMNIYRISMNICIYRVSTIGGGWESNLVLAFECGIDDPRKVDLVEGSWFRVQGAGFRV